MANKKDATAESQEQIIKAADPAAVKDPAAEAEKIVADAQAQAAKILEDAKRQAAEELEAAKAPAQAQAAESAATDPGDELVSIRLFKDNDKYKDDVFVAVNGERLQIRRGETVKIKRKFADVLEQSMQQDTATANMIERQSAEYEAKAAALNL